MTGAAVVAGGPLAAPARKVGSNGGGATTASAVAALTLLAAVALLPVVAAAQGPPSSDQILDGVVRTYVDASNGWLVRIFPLAQRLFALLATLEFAVSGLLWAVGRDGLDAVAAALLRKFMLLSFLFSLIWEFPLWLPYVTRGFEAACQTGAGIGAVNPSLVLDYGLTIGGNILLAVGDAGILVDPAGTVLGELTVVVIILAYSLIAVQLCLTLCEVSFVLTGGVLFLGFAGFRSTAPFAEGYLLFVFQMGIKVYLLYLLVGVGTTLSQQWAAIDFQLLQTPQAPSFGPEFAVMTGALVFCLLVWRTGGIANRIAHAASFRLGEALR